MKVKFAYFSGTGNTKKAVQEVEECLKSKGVETLLFDISSPSSIDDDFDVLVLSYPIYGFNCPYNFLTFVKNLPDGNGRPVYVVKTSGEPLKLNNASSYKISKILRKKGYIFKKDYHIVMPYNMIFRHTDRMASRFFAVLKTRAEEISKEICDLQESPLKVSLFAKFLSFVCRIQYPFYRFNTRHFFKVNPKKCIKCMACVKNCPTQNIEYKDGKFIFHKNCVGCVRCSFNCPADAFKIGMLEPLHVNGKYKFTEEFSSSDIPKFCNKAYKKYFSKYEN